MQNENTQTEEQHPEWEVSIKNNPFYYGWRYYHNKYYDYDRPDSYCPLFWEGTLGLLLMIMSPILNLFSLIYGKYKGDEEKEFLHRVYLEDSNAWERFLLNLMIILFYYMMVLIAPGHGAMFRGVPWEAWVYLWIIPVLALGGVIFAAVGLVELFKLLSKKKIKPSQNLIIIKEGINAKINKMCPRIKWKDE